MRPTCGTCTHWMRYNGETKGPCLLEPPTVFVSGEQRRPVMKEGEPGCSHHTEGEQAVKEKVQVPTHGAVVQAAREAQHQAGRVDVPGVVPPLPPPTAKPSPAPSAPQAPSQGQRRRR